MSGSLPTLGGMRGAGDHFSVGDRIAYYRRVSEPRTGGPRELPWAAILRLI